MKNLKIGMLFIASVFCTVSYAQQQKNKLSLGYGITKGDYWLHGLEFEYSRKLNKSFSVSANIGVDRYNGFPKFANGGINSGSNANPQLANYIKNNNPMLGELWARVNQNIYSIHLNYHPINNQRNNLYLIGGIGLNIQDALAYGIENITSNGTSGVASYTDYYSQRGAATIVGRAGIGYDYNMKGNWFVGSNLRVQLPIARDAYYFKHGGVGFDETLRLGVKVGKSF